MVVDDANRAYLRETSNDGTLVSKTCPRDSQGFADADPQVDISAEALKIFLS